MLSAAKRMHSSACFRKLSELDRFEISMPNHCTASRVLSVAYATEKDPTNFFMNYGGDGPASAKLVCG